MKKYGVMGIGIMLFLLMSSAIYAADVHSVWAQKPYYLQDGQTGQWYDNVRGTITMNWKDKTRYGFFNAIVTPINSPILLKYEFVLVSISSCNDDYIEGLWDIYKNGVLVATGYVGKLYGIDAPIGQYFKLYIGDNSQCNNNKWHLSGYVTDRLDY